MNVRSVSPWSVEVPGYGIMPTEEYQARLGAAEANKAIRREALYEQSRNQQIASLVGPLDFSLPYTLQLGGIPVGTFRTLAKAKKAAITYPDKLNFHKFSYILDKEGKVVFRNYAT